MRRWTRHAAGMPFSGRGWLLCLLLLWPWTSWADIDYVVKRNESLSSISHQFGMSPARLAEHNGLPPRAQLRIGQRLRIPSNKTPSFGSSLLPEGLGDIPVSKRWQNIV